MSISESPGKASLPTVIRSPAGELIARLFRAKNLLLTRLATDDAHAVRFLGLKT